MTGPGRRSAPAPLPDTGVGPEPVPGRLDVLVPGLARLTAPNPGVMTGPGTNTYLVGYGGPGDIVVVDPGPDEPGHLRRITEAAESRGQEIRSVLVTHGHPDHAPGAPALASMTGATLVAHGPTEDLVPDVAAEDGWSLDADSFRVSALHTPGHASDHLCYVVDLEDSTRVVLSGDHVMDRVTVVIAPPDGDMTAYLQSLERLLVLEPGASAIAPGHGRLLRDPDAVVRAIVAHRLAREAVVADALGAAGPASVDELVPAVYGDVDPALHPVARESLWAHLLKLVAEGRAAEVAPDADGGAPRFRSIESIRT